MEREDSDNERVDDEESTDEECVDVYPSEWSNEDFSGLQIREGHHVPWEYKENEVIQGARYRDKEDLTEAVKQWTILLRREFWVVKSSKSVYEVKCGQSDNVCVEKYHRNMTSAFIATEMYGAVVNNLGYEPKSIIRHIEEKYNYTISYAKAWRAKQKIVERWFGMFEASYDNLSKLLAVILQINSGGFYDIKSFPSTQNPLQAVLQRVFFSLSACMFAFVHCRPILCIDGTFLTGKYKGQILTAIGVDGNNQVVQVAFAFVESENTDSWYWFLKRVKDAVVRMRPGVCLIHDRHVGLLRAIELLRDGSLEEGLAPQWPDVENPSKVRNKAGRRKTRRIRNDMDESELGRRKKRCSRCDGEGHTYKNCPGESTSTVGTNTEGPWQQARADGSRPVGEGMDVDTPELLDPILD
ncbi:uncharacterized protein LOC121054425 [Oryza brachyantha]|uniref:uncharacterized protein LOC121054425 n=1 Tax=Oryza brachyantha TaxID=4533 RepID=UPI001ADBB17D|nr:uncharacterized protein LOC121054425 [Oryza brachyantha]